MSNNVYDRIFARFYDTYMEKPEKVELARRRRRLLRDLKGNILEIGAGTGASFQWYGPAAHVLAVEPSLPMASRARARINGKDIELVEAGIGDPILDERIKPGSLDAIVCALVLCTVPDLSGALSRIESWLKPGGKLVLLEHVRSHGKITGAFQTAINPVWKVFAGGCSLNRPTDLLVKNRKFKVQSEQQFRLTMPFYEATLERLSD